MIKVIYVLLFVLIANLNLNAEGLRIEAKELSSNLKKYKILDARSKNDFLKNHIENAINFPSNLTYENRTLNGKITEPNKMQTIIQNLGININDNIVIYDEGSFFNSARVFWSLEVYGFKNLKILNASFNNWQSKGYKTTKEIISPKKSNYITLIDNKKLATKFTTQIATKNKSQVIIDARTYQSYIGEESSAKRFGHIPKAIHISAAQNIKTVNNANQIKDLDELSKVYKDLDKKKKIVIYCSIGRVAAMNYFALRELGFNVANYDASWKEWGNDYNLPIIKKTSSK